MGQIAEEAKCRLHKVPAAEAFQPLDAIGIDGFPLLIS
jgi:hypothetical protein